MGSPLESETERHSRPRVQKRKPKLRWREGGTNRIQISGQGAGPRACSCLPTISPSLGLSATLCSVPEAQTLADLPKNSAGRRTLEGRTGEQNSTVGTGH